MDFSNIIVEENLLDEIYSTYKEIKLPNTLWASYLIEVPVRILVFSKIELLPFLKLEQMSAPVTTKQVTLQDDGIFRIYIFNKLLCTAESKNVLEEVEKLIQKVDEFNTCIGGPSSNEFFNVCTKHAFRDIIGKWRHSLCTLVLERGNRCNKCIKLEHRLKNLSEVAAKKENILKTLKLQSSREKQLELQSKVFDIVEGVF